MPRTRAYLLYARPLSLPLRHPSYIPCRLSSTSVATPTPNTSSTVALPARWLSDLKQRIGKCIIFGLNQKQVDEVGNVMRVVARDWRELLAGSEGFLTGRAGYEGREVAWGEMDVMTTSLTPRKGHVNNVTYVRYAESARINWILNFANRIDPKHKREWSELLTSKGNGLILRSMRTDYKFPMAWPDRISVYHKLRAAPTASTDSFSLDVLILSEGHQRPAARCVEEIVVYDYRRGVKSPLKDFMIDKFRETFELQEQSKMRNEKRVTELLQRVQWIEKQTWDRPEAVEDMGNG